ncbi:MAG: glycosyltransferase family 4 protein, partial [Desulfobacterales bacterium]
MNGATYFLYLLCIGLSAVGAWIFSKHGHRLNLLDQPNDRSSHRNSTPKGGGIGILAGFIASALISKLPGFFWIPAVMLSMVSFVGDRYHLLPIIRLLFQFTASVIFLFGVWNTHPYSSVGYILIIPLALYIVGTTNYYNFMDGINGLAAVTGIVGFGLLAFYGAYSAASPGLIPLNICMALCCMGFLPFNMPNAKVFMGDVGSILLGFVFAVMVVWYSTSLIDFLCLASFLFPFYADEITTELIRLKNGEKLWLPHRKHLYQLLANEYSISHWKVSMGYGIAQLIIGASILFMFERGVFAIISTL